MAAVDEVFDSKGSEVGRFVLQHTHDEIVYHFPQLWRLSEVTLILYSQ